MSQTLVTRGYATGLLPSNDATQTGRFLQDILYEALVVDVILDHTHKYYSVDGFNVGNIKVRIFSQHYGVSDDLLPWARPIDSTIQEFPVFGEYVYLERIGSALWYRKKLPIARRLNQNSMINVNRTIDDSVFGIKTTNKITSNEELSFDKFKFGKYFKPDSRVRQLKAFEGDTIFQGRMGASIRFGSSKLSNVDTGLAPNIIFRVGQGKNLETKEASAKTPYGLLIEDINKDVSSIWMTTDQDVGFIPATNEAGSNQRSLFNPKSIFDKSQIIANSGRVVLNAKKSHVMLFANQEIYLNAFERVGIDTDGSVLMSGNNDIDLKAGRNLEATVDADITLRAGSDIALLAAERLSIAGKQLFLGTVQNSAEPLVGGTSLSIFLARLILSLMGTGVVPPQLRYQLTGAPVPPIITPLTIIDGPATFAHVFTPFGPGMLNPVIRAGLRTMYNELAQFNPGSLPPLPFSGAPFNSIGTFTGLSNEETGPVISKNDFKSGKQLDQDEDISWKLSQKNVYTVTE